MKLFEGVLDRVLEGVFEGVLEGILEGLLEGFCKGMIVKSSSGFTGARFPKLNQVLVMPELEPETEFRNLLAIVYFIFLNRENNK